MNPTATSPLDEKISHSLKLLSRRGGDYRKDERTFIAETLKELAVLVVDKLGGHRVAPVGEDHE